jgi:hypothetical protein
MSVLGKLGGCIVIFLATAYNIFYKLWQRNAEQRRKALVKERKTATESFGKGTQNGDGKLWQGK